jgi:hypothetical protein
MTESCPECRSGKCGNCSGVAFNAADEQVGCPCADAGHQPVIGLATLQFAWGGLFNAEPADDYMVHLVRSTGYGTPGPSLCGIDRFLKTGPGWSVGGGISGPGVVHKPCPGCVATAKADFPGLLPRASSTGGREIITALTSD